MGYGSSMKKQSDPNDPAALLDALMGSTRNMTETEKATSGPRWQDRDVCEKFLVGCCPGNLFHASSKRSDVRPCTLTHAESIRTDYEKTNPSEPGSKRRGIERRLLRELQILVKDMDHKVRRTKERVELEMKAAAAASKAPPDEATTKALADITGQIAELVRKAEEAGENAALSKSAGTLRLEDVGTRFKGVNASGAISRKAFVKNLLEMDIENATAEEAEAWFDERVQAEQPADAATADATSQSINLLATLKAARQASVEAKESEAVLSKTLVALRRTARSQQVAIRKEASAAAHEAKARELAVQAAKAEQVKAEAEAAEAKRLAKLEKAKAKAAEAKAFQEKVQERRSEAKERQSHAMGQAGGFWGDLAA